MLPCRVSCFFKSKCTEDLVIMPVFKLCFHHFGSTKSGTFHGLLKMGLDFLSAGFKVQSRVHTKHMLMIYTCRGEIKDWLTLMHVLFGKDV